VHSSVERNQLINYKIAADVNEVVGNNTETKQQQEPAQKLCSQVEKKKKTRQSQSQLSSIICILHLDLQTVYISD